jgi:hypothetical protein
VGRREERTGMEDRERSIYLEEAATQCRFALNAILGLQNVLPRVGEAARAGNHALRQVLQDEVFRSIHSCLTHASNVSRIFWPAQPEMRARETHGHYVARCAEKPKNKRASELRAAVGLPDEHYLKGRTLRDHLEHFDERLDSWRAESKDGSFVQDCIGPRGAIVGIDEDDYMRWFDPTTGSMWFRGERYDLRELVAAIEDVLKRITGVLPSDKRLASPLRQVGPVESARPQPE